MSCKTKPGQSSRQCLRMLRPLPPDTPRPPIFNLKLAKKTVFVKKTIFQFFGSFCGFLAPIGPVMELFILVFVCAKIDFSVFL